MTAGGPRARRLGVFAVEDTSAQLTWGALGPGPVRIRAADTTRDLEADGGPGAIVLDDLPPSRRLTVEVTGDGVPEGRRTLLARTLAALPGPELTRLSTISDLHIGLQGFGYFGTITEDADHLTPWPERTTAAAFAEALEWGTERMVVKGDVTQHGRPDEWRTFARLRHAVADLPVDIIPGNHDVRVGRHLSPVDAGRSFDLDVIDRMRVRHLPGLCLILLDTTVPGRNIGTLDPYVEPAVDTLRSVDADIGVLICVHHQLQPHVVAEGWPWGVQRAEARRFIEAVGAAHHHVLVTSGHTHRHRRWAHAGVTTTQVGSTSDHPGVWAGYVVHESGMRQVVRRIAQPDVLPWSERARDAALGAWGQVSPGRREARCFTLHWRRPLG